MTWTNVAKPEESSVATSVAVLNQSVQPFGLLTAITSIMTSETTSSVTGSSVTTGWSDTAKPVASVGAYTKVIKPIASVGAWTNISKPT